MEEAKKPMGWKELYLKEDWWAIYLGLGIVVAAIAFFYAGNPSEKKDSGQAGMTKLRFACGSTNDRISK